MTKKQENIAFAKMLKEFLLQYKNKTIYLGNMGLLLNDAEQFLKE